MGNNRMSNSAARDVHSSRWATIALIVTSAVFCVSCALLSNTSSNSAAKEALFKMPTVDRQDPEYQAAQEHFKSVSLRSRSRVFEEAAHEEAMQADGAEPDYVAAPVASLLQQLPEDDGLVSPEVAELEEWLGGDLERTSMRAKEKAYKEAAEEEALMMMVEEP